MFVSEDAHGSSPHSDKGLEGAEVSDLELIDDETKSLKFGRSLVLKDVLSDYISHWIVLEDLVHAPWKGDTPSPNLNKDVVSDSWSLLFL